MSGTSSSATDRAISHEKDMPDASGTEFQKRIDELTKQKVGMEKMDDKSHARFGTAQKLRNETVQIKHDLTIKGLTIPSDVRARMVQQLDGVEKFAWETINVMKGGQQAMARNRQDISLIHSTPISNGGFSPFVRRTTNVRDNAGDDTMQELLRSLTEIKESQQKKDTELGQKLDRMSTSLNNVTTRLDGIECKVGRMERMESPEPQRKYIQTMGQDVLLIKEQFSSFQVRFDGMNNRIDNLLVQMNQRPVSPVTPQVIQVHLTGQILPQVVAASSTGGSPSYGVESTPFGVPQPGKVVQQKATSVVKAEQQDRRSNSPHAVPSTTTTNNPPMVVNVPKDQQRDSTALDRLINTAACFPAVIPEVKGAGTVNWGASASQPSKPAQIAQVSQPLSSSMSPSASSQPTTTTSTVPAEKPKLFQEFAGFGATSQQEKPSTPKTDQKSGQPGTTSIFGNAATSTPFSSLFSNQPSSSPAGTSFAALASSVPSSGFSKSDKGFAGAGAKLFGSKPAGDVEEGEVEESPEGFVPNVDYKPLVSLPEVKVKTGEEDWDKVFSDRAKLFRYDKTTQEWKERGLGEMTIQTERGRKSVFRILMRYEKTLKICANHRIHPSMNLQPFSETDKKTVRWTAQDFADGEPRIEMLAVRFKTREQADKFKEAFNDAKKRTDNDGGPVAEEKKEPLATETAKPLSDLFKLAAGSWDCPGCYCKNGPERTVCPACQTPKLGATAPASSQLKTDTSLFGSSGLNLVGVPAAGGFSFGYQSKPAESAPLFGGANSPSKPASTETSVSTQFAGFGISKPVGKTTEGSSGGGFSFGQPAATGGFSFSFGSPQSSLASKPAQKGEEDEESDNDPEAFEPGGQFASVVTLPEKVELSTGEENEIEMYSQRAKLYRFAEGEWKERGLGDLKMLKEQNGNKIRLLMRREKILKVCCNHYIREGMKLSPMPNTKNAWIWDALDFSEGSSQRETFAVKFKHDAHVKEFKELFERAKQIANSTKVEKVDQFERVTVDENEAMLPIAESGKKAIQAMSMNNPFGSANKNDIQQSRPAEPSVKIEQVSDTEDSNEPSEGTEKLGDVKLRHFSVIHNAKDQPLAVGIPDKGFYVLRKPQDLQLVLSADKKSKEEAVKDVENIAHLIDVSDLSIPEAVKRYTRAMRVREIGDDEAWRMTLFERQLALQKQSGNGSGPSVTLGPGVFRIVRDGDPDSAYLMQLFSSDRSTELAVQNIVSDANLTVDRQRLVAKWTANDYALNVNNPERVVCEIKFSSVEALSDFEQVFREGVTVAQELEISLSTR